ncbi:MAG: CotH kinase family protein [Vicingaceae bacterium]|nr:CotH kinase family protein [Vicingaceae bacterium]
MSGKVKKYIVLFLAIFLVFAGYWYFFSEKWKLAVNQEHFWHYSFEKKNLTNLKNIKFELNKNELIIDEELKNKNLVLQTTINIEDVTLINKGHLAFNYKYSAKIYINNHFCIDVNKDLITPPLEGVTPKEITITEYWKNREVLIPQNLLKDGPNTISVVVYNVANFKTIKTNNNPLAFLVKGNKNGFDTNYKIEKPKTSFSSSTLPIFKINTFNKVIPDEPKTNAHLTIAQKNNGTNLLSDSTIGYKIEIERRGNTSQSFAKKSYSFKLEKKDSLIGLSKSKKWVLYGPYADKSLVRNALAYSLYRQMGNYTPETKFIELVINNNYQGIYLLTEKIQIGKEHLNITKLKVDKKDETKMSGGYVLEIDRNTIQASFPNDTTAHNLYYGVYSPKQKKLSTNVLNTIKEQYSLFEQHLYEKDNYLEYLDINSFVDYLIITEVSRNIDGYRLSTFMYNPDINAETPKFYIGPIWDYNFSFGLANYHDGYKTEGYVYILDKFVPFYWHTLLKDSTFNNTLKKRYSALRKTSLSDKNIINTIDELNNLCEPSLANNFAKWTVLESEDFWPNYFLGKTHKDEIDYLKNWIKKRLQFLDDELLVKYDNKK